MWMHVEVLDWDGKRKAKKQSAGLEKDCSEGETRAY